MGFSKKIFSEKLKLEAERLGKNLDLLGKDAGIANLYLYTQKESKIPRADTLQKLADIGVNINYLLTDEPPAILVKENPNNQYDYKIKALEERITKLESKLFQLTEENEELKKENILLKHSISKNINNSKTERNN